MSVNPYKFLILNKKNINQINNQINLSDFAPGIYTLQVKTANSVAVKKFIKTE